MKELISNKFQHLVDTVDSKKLDYVCYSIMAINFITTFYLFTSIFRIIKIPLLNMHSIVLYSYIFISTALLFYFSMLGDVLSKPVNRPRVFLYTTIILSLATFSLLAEIFNYTITNLLDSLIRVTEIPSFLIHTNVRLITIFIPLLIVILTFSKSYIISFNSIYKKELLEYKLDIFTKNVDRINKFTSDLTICNDIETDKPIVVSEKISYRHLLLAGSSGSGKTALEIRPLESQLFYKKAFYREELKRLSYEALEEGLCYLKYPITNKFLNENFSMDYISVYDDKLEEFKNKFKDLIIGIRKSEIQLFNKTISLDEEIYYEIPIKEDATKLTLNLQEYFQDMIKDEINLDITDKPQSIKKDIYTLYITKKPYTREIVSEEGEKIQETYTKTIKEGEDVIVTTEFIEIKINSNKHINYKLELNINQKSESKIIFRNLGVTVIAPDGGLAEDTVKIARENGIKVHKIDPKMEEINKGSIAKFNPFLVGSPEKTADIVSSILTAMENSSGKDGNAYFTNASIRAIRNTVILLKVMYPILHNGENPILTDVLDLLNNFSLVIPYVEAMKEDEYLKIRWRSVIDYFESSFYPAPTDEMTGKPMRGTHIGSKTEKNEQAINGVINQLDNFLGREEIKYIFCDRNESLNLVEVLEKGECISISTRQSELGDVLGKAFALMMILSIQNAVLGRFSEDENPEIPYYLIIDEFPFYLNEQTEVFFTFCRKYKTSCCVAIQNLSQLDKISSTFRQVILTNTTTKIVLPGSNVEDREYYSKYFGITEEFDVQTSVSSNPVISENAKYSESMRGSMKEKSKITQQDLSELQFKRCFYNTVNPKGVNIVGKGYIDFVKLTDKNTIKIAEYDFAKYNDIEDILNTSIVDLDKDTENIATEDIDISNISIDMKELEESNNLLVFSDTQSTKALEEYLTEKLEQLNNNTLETLVSSNKEEIETKYEFNNTEDINLDNIEVLFNENDI